MFLGNLIHLLDFFFFLVKNYSWRSTYCFFFFFFITQILGCFSVIWYSESHYLIGIEFV